MPSCLSAAAPGTTVELGQAILLDIMTQPWEPIMQLIKWAHSFQSC